ncbi:tetratricopeptide repeat protein [candidate division GN15 bacterium]|nr:tetratricopeptide repeat protein [candidate division GN15 bacterium]
MHTGKVQQALTAADSLLADDSKAAHPYALKGMVAEQAGNLEQAARHYQQFLELAPLDPDAEVVRHRLDRIKSRL